MVPPPPGDSGVPSPKHPSPAHLQGRSGLGSHSHGDCQPTPLFSVFSSSLEGWGGQGAWTLTQIWKWAQKGQVVTCPGTYGGRSSTSHLLREVLLTIHSPCPLRTLRLFVPGKPIRRPPRPLTCTIPAAQAAPHSP